MSEEERLLTVAERDNQNNYAVIMVLWGDTPRTYDRLEVLEVQGEVITASVNHTRRITFRAPEEGLFPKGCVLLVVPAKESDSP